MQILYCKETFYMIAAILILLQCDKYRILL